MAAVARCAPVYIYFTVVLVSAWSRECAETERETMCTEFCDS